MIRVVYSLEVPEAAQPAFARAWREAMAAIRSEAPGAKDGAVLLRCARDPNKVVIVTRWESEAAWREFWAKGPPEPQGDPERNEIFIEIEELGNAKEGQPCSRS